MYDVRLEQMKGSLDGKSKLDSLGVLGKMLFLFVLPWIARVAVPGFGHGLVH